MEIGKYFEQNQSRIAALTEDDWKVALVKGKEHIKWRIKQKTLSGAHSSAHLGTDPVEYYLGLSYEKILSGEWEWKQEYNLTEQLIRIINSYISKEVEKVLTDKAESFKVEYRDIEEEFYMVEAPSNTTREGLIGYIALIDHSVAL